ncbi:hypothetical protein MTR67_036184 [Solanum verrucosum]|uniref:Uncharacterized protein n=1 Tax=Solanum verrucosum TaxID=315347 RepID=A0AAF0ZN05_SOLVR|nr:hypothetical protein MTR67_036184 [Solanum verrucosum]
MGPVAASVARLFLSVLDARSFTIPREVLWGCLQARHDGAKTQVRCHGLLFANDIVLIDKIYGGVNATLEETESEDDLLDEDEDVEDNDHESEVPEHADPVGQKIEASPAPKETERQLSKKERRKKELAELDSLLADFGVEQKEKGPDDLPDSLNMSTFFSFVSTDVGNEKKEGQPAEDVEKKNGGAKEPKSAKKKKKKDKASKEVKESEDQPNSVGATVLPEETGGAEQVEDASTVDMKERLKRVASAKKKKSGKETDGAARAAATEAAARSARLAAAKKKEKSHYNQQPMRDDQRFSDLVMLHLLAQTTSSSPKKTGLICGGGRWEKAEATMVLGVGS